MSKAFYRFLRGELNGFYIKALNNVQNYWTSEIKTFFHDFKRMVFKINVDDPDEESPISGEMLHSIGIVTGVFVPIISNDSTPYTIKLSTSHLVNGVDYSERGLFSTDNEDFQFYRTDTQEYSTDINTLASSKNRSGLVESGATVKGYAGESTTVLKVNGDLNEAALLETPPVNESFTAVYGKKYQFLSTDFLAEASITNAVYIEFIKAFQWVRHNGVSINSLVQLMKYVCPNYVFLIDFTWDSNAHCIVDYGIDEDYTIDAKIQRSAVFQSFVTIKFPQFTMRERTITVTRDAEGNPTKVVVNS